jgi:hypothetical protein
MGGAFGGVVGGLNIASRNIQSRRQIRGATEPGQDPSFLERLRQFATQAGTPDQRDIAKKLLPIEEQLQQLSQFRVPGGLAPFGLAGRNLRGATPQITQIQKQLFGGADPQDLGLRTPEDIEKERRELLEQGATILFGPQQSAVSTPLQRLQQGLMGTQAARGFEFGGAVQAQQQAAIPFQLASLQGAQGQQFGQSGQLGGGQPGQFQAGQQSFQQPQMPGILSLLGQQGAGALGAISDISQVGGRFNTFNPPPFFNLL